MNKDQTTTTRTFNDKPRPVWEEGLMDMLADIIIFQNEVTDWLEAEVNHMKLVMAAAQDAIDDEDYDGAYSILLHAIERPL